MDLDEFQKRARRTRVFQLQSPGGPDHHGELARHYLLAGLAAQVGEMANRLKKRLRDGADYVRLKDEIEERIGRALWYLAIFADEIGISMGKAALDNIRFNERRWRQYVGGDEGLPQRDFDEGSPPEQCLPERLTAHFETSLEEGLSKTTVWIYPNWPSRDGRIQFGDTIDDNSPTEDHYRYHDVFHFAYFAFLGWSPVVRKLMRCKRKYNKDADRIEDGARARDTEEAVTAFIYSYVSGQDFLTTSDNLDTGLLTTVRTLLRAYEAGLCLEKEWELAIFRATESLRHLVDANGGWIIADRKNRQLHFEASAPSGETK